MTLEERNKEELESLYERVTAAIFEAEAAERSGELKRTSLAYLVVSFIEADIAELIPASEPEGEIARRGAVRAALTAKQNERAHSLVNLYLSGGGSRELKASLETLLTADAHVAKSSNVTDPILVRPKALFRLNLAA